MRQVLRDLAFVAASAGLSLLVAAGLFALLKPCAASADLPILFIAFSFSPVFLYIGVRLNEHGLWPTLARAGCLWLFLAFCLAIVLPNLSGAVGRSKQKAAMAQLRGIGSSVERRDLPLPQSSRIGPLDPWGHPIVIVTSGSQYYVLSCGECGVRDHDTIAAYSPGPTSSYESDIVFSNGQFLAYPEGAQH